MQLSRKRNTIDIFIGYQSDNYYENAHAVFNKQTRKGKLDYKQLKPATRQKDRASIHGYLNFYEMIAVGIREGAFNEQMAKEYFETMVFADYPKVKNYIQNLRKDEKDKEILIQFENLHNAWKDKKFYQSWFKRWVG